MKIWKMKTGLALVGRSYPPSYNIKRLFITPQYVFKGKLGVYPTIKASVTIPSIHPSVTPWLTPGEVEDRKPMHELSCLVFKNDISSKEVTYILWSLRECYVPQNRNFGGVSLFRGFLVFFRNRRPTRAERSREEGKGLRNRFHKVNTFRRVGFCFY